MTLEKLLENAFTERVAVYVPSTIAVSGALPEAQRERYIERALRFLAERYGGATAIPARGAYVAANGDLIQERIELVYAYTAKLTDEDAAAIEAFCHTLKAELEQESIAAEYNGSLFFF